ncbi:DUF1501 domain-containing protein [Thalassoroseus pseudoceratinae]|uniref:DUF1501 domain-containing protein n=1 Tax=Thalassoroseus pseudoceratinae TaxID=2713176 RepID=UPI0014225312|nr:DUF1501 domain-containing protein [Thalassoroseus pseudoceratinae]
MPHIPRYSSRREFLLKGGTGFGSIALAHLLQSEQASASTSPYAPKQTHFQPTAKNVIFLFMEGGPSQMDTFDPKPKLNELAGQQLPDSFGEVITPMGEYNAPLLGSKRKWKQHGESGTWVSDWLPETAKCVDDIAVIRSCWTDGINHSGGVCQMNTGTPVAGRPSLGAWVSYGLGTENQSLPAFVVMTDSATKPTNGPRNWGTGFMPAVYQGTHLSPSGSPIPNLSAPKGVSDRRQTSKLDFLNQLNSQHAQPRGFQTELDARIAAYELAFRMQATAPSAIDLTAETKETQDLYGLNEKKTAAFGRNCLLARRLVERGVRFVQLYHGSGSKWDAHSNIERNHADRCAESDKPVAALLTDLKQRGMLDDTLVIWGGEFGRTPMSEKGNGRDHNTTGFTMWMAGGGVKGGQTIGATDELGLHAIEDRLHVHDLHATILHLLGLHHMEVVYHYKGRPERPTLNEGEAYEKITTG